MLIGSLHSLFCKLREFLKVTAIVVKVVLHTVFTDVVRGQTLQKCQPLWISAENRPKS